MAQGTRRGTFLLGTYPNLLPIACGAKQARQDLVCRHQAGQQIAMPLLPHPRKYSSRNQACCALKLLPHTIAYTRDSVFSLSRTLEDSRQLSHPSSSTPTHHPKLNRVVDGSALGLHSALGWRAGQSRPGSTIAITAISGVAHDVPRCSRMPDRPWDGLLFPGPVVSSGSSAGPSERLS